MELGFNFLGGCLISVAVFLLLFIQESNGDWFGTISGGD